MVTAGTSGQNPPTASQNPVGSMAEFLTRPPRTIYFTAEPLEYPRRDWPESFEMVGPATWGPPSTAPQWLAAVDRPVVLASNFSIGIPVMKLLLERLAVLLPEDFMPEQIETHHRHKLDKPSGTARSLSLAGEAKRGRGSVPTHSVRVGGVTGDHAWIFSDDEETLTLTHRAHSRRAFLQGVAPAVRFAERAKPGLYGLEDILTDGG